MSTAILAQSIRLNLGVVGPFSPQDSSRRSFSLGELLATRHEGNNEQKTPLWLGEGVRLVRRLPDREHAGDVIVGRNLPFALSQQCASVCHTHDSPKAKGEVPDPCSFTADSMGASLGSSCQQQQQEGLPTLLPRSRAKPSRETGLDAKAVLAPMGPSRLHAKVLQRRRDDSAVPLRFGANTRFERCAESTGDSNDATLDAGDVLMDISSAAAELGALPCRPDCSETPEMEAGTMDMRSLRHISCVVAELPDDVGVRGEAGFSVGKVHDSAKSAVRLFAAGSSQVTTLVRPVLWWRSR